MRFHTYLGKETWNVVLGLNSLMTRLWCGSSSAYSSKPERMGIWTWSPISDTMWPPRRAWDSYWTTDFGQFNDSVIEIFVHWKLYSQHLTIAWRLKFWTRSPEISVRSPSWICRGNLLSRLSSVQECPRQTYAYGHFRALKPLSWCATLLYCGWLPSTQLCVLKLPVEWSKNHFSLLQSDFIKRLEQVWLIKKCWHQLAQLCSLSETS